MHRPPHEPYHYPEDSTPATGPALRPGRYPMTIVAGIVVIVALALAATLTADKDHGAQINGVIAVLAAPTVVAFMALLRSESNRNQFEHQGQVTHAKLDQQNKQLEATRSDLRDAIEPVERATAAVAESAHKMEQAINGNLEKRIREIAEEVRRAEREQLLDDPTYQQRVVEMFRPVITDLAVKTAHEVCASDVMRKLVRDEIDREPTPRGPRT